MYLKRILISSILLTGMIGISPTVFSHNMAACKSDMDNYCKDAQGWDAKKQCIDQNKSQFSAECQAMIQKHEQFRAACKSDKEKFCGNQEGPGKGKSCLRDHINELSSTCRNLLNDHS
jgi:hypothetical protein